MVYWYEDCRFCRKSGKCGNCYGKGCGRCNGSGVCKACNGKGQVYKEKGW